jgi:hypothetical protein
MRKIYPKLITTLFLVLFAAMILKYADADSKSSDTASAAIHMHKGSN